MYSDPILKMMAELRLLIDSKQEEVNEITKQLWASRNRVIELETKVMALSEDLMKDTQNG